MSMTGSSIRRRTWASTEATTRPTSDAARRRPRRSRGRPARSRPTPVSARRRGLAAGPATVASLTRLSPSRMVTTRRGRPTRRATAVVATASGGATTAPSANAAANESSGTTQRSTTATTKRGEGHQPDREQGDRAAVAADVDQRRADRRGVQQGRQQADQHQVGVEPVVRDERQVGADDPDHGQQRAAPTGRSGAAARPPPPPRRRWPRRRAQSAPEDYRMRLPAARRRRAPAQPSYE